MAIQINLDATNNNVDDLSFGLLRTNPTISTNAKLLDSGPAPEAPAILDEETAE